MKRLYRLGLSAVLASMFVCGSASLLGVTAGGNLVRINPGTGAGSFVGPVGAGALDSMTYQNGLFLATSFTTGQLVTVNPVTGAGTATPVAPADIRGLSHGPNGVLYGIRQAAVDMLARLDVAGAAWVNVGPTGFADVQALACAPDGTMYAWDTVVGLLKVDPLTGAAIDVNAGVPGSPAIQALEVSPDNVLYGCETDLYTINPVTGAPTLVGGGGYAGVRGLAWEPTQCIAVGFAGGCYEINYLTGVGVGVGAVGFGNLNSMAYWRNEFVTSTDVVPIELIQLNLVSGAGTPMGIASGDFRATEEVLGRLYAVANGVPDMLLLLNTAGSFVPVGPTGFNNIEGLGYDRFTNTLYAWDTVSGLLTMNPATGMCADVNPGLGAPAPIATLAVGPDGNLYGANNVFFTINPATGAIGPIGAGGFVDVRGMSFGRRQYHIPISTFSIAPGAVFSGGPGNTTTSDNSYWQLRPGPVLVATQPPLVVVVNGAIPGFNPSELRLNLESKGSSGTLREKVEMFNFRTGVYDVVLPDSALPTSDTQHVFSAPVPDDYCGAGGVVRARLTYRASGAVLVFPWIVSIDRLTWDYLR